DTSRQCPDKLLEPLPFPQCPVVPLLPSHSCLRVLRMAVNGTSLLSLVNLIPTLALRTETLQLKHFSASGRPGRHCPSRQQPAEANGAGYEADPHHYPGTGSRLPADGTVRPRAALSGQWPSGNRGGRADSHL